MDINTVVANDPSYRQTAIDIVESLGESLKRRKSEVDPRIEPVASSFNESSHICPPPSDVNDHHDESVDVNLFATTVITVGVARTMKADAVRYSCGIADQLMFDEGTLRYTTEPSAIQIVVSA